jgi:tyrosyl-tRNA synthetase
LRRGKEPGILPPMHMIDELRARCLIKDITDEDGLRARLDEGPITFYCGHDPTAPSLTAGNLVQIMYQAHIQRFGHRPIVLMGGGTALVGDPTGKSTTRKVLTEADIDRNLAGQKPQFERFVRFGDGPTDAILVNNHTWLKELHWLQFLRDVGCHFSVNEMLQAQTYADRLEKQQHLSFVEFNYRLVQAYDFLHLLNAENCELQVGGSDQWGNCVAGTELIRKSAGRKAWVMTSPLLLTSSGVKMGKTEKGSVWLDRNRTSPFEYFQFWINSDDADVGRFLRIFTFLPLDEIDQLEGVEGASALTATKARLAWEATALCHGAADANKALATSMVLFGLEKHFSWSDVVPSHDQPRPDLPSAELDRALFAVGFPLFKLFLDAGLVGSGKQAKTLIKQGGAYVGGEKATDPFAMIGEDALSSDGSLLLRAGKKKYCLVVAR